MEYTTLGDTGMEVSRICLGCMSFGDEWSWTLDEGERTEIIERAIERLREYAEGDRPFYHAPSSLARRSITSRWASRPARFSISWGSVSRS